MRWFEREYWYPELRGLSDFDQREALERAKNRVQTQVWRNRWYLATGALMLIALLCWEFYPDDWLLASILRHGLWVIGWMLVCAILVCWTRFTMTRVALRTWINHNLDDGDVRLCAGCKYDLRGCGGEHCPECGEWIPVKTREWIERQQRDEHAQP